MSPEYVSGEYLSLWRSHSSLGEVVIGVFWTLDTAESRAEGLREEIKALLAYQEPLKPRQSEQY
ncbi:MAG: hypothetical protein ACSHX0_05505 [Akkermansiaceae bacterium]